jgi:hypothetical protein
MVGMLPSPLDSEEWPTSYKRGCVGLAHAVRQVEDRTLLNLEYIGEWHSHPPACRADMSGVDKTAMAEIASEMLKAGLPGLIAIVGDNGIFSVHLSEDAL